MLNKYVILVVLGLIGLISMTSSYTAPTYNDINFSLCSGYTAPTYNDVNFTLGLSDACSTDSCSYSSGNWEIDCSENCSIHTNVVIGLGGDLIFNGVGRVNLNADITNFTNIDMGSSTEVCNIIFKDGAKLISS